MTKNIRRVIAQKYYSIKHTLKKTYDYLRLHNKNFSIISNNCWGGFVYQRFGLPYNTPTIGCGIMDSHFFKLCNNLDYYLKQDLVFVDPKNTEHYEIRRAYYGKEIDYPVGQIGDINIWFTHYNSKEEAKSKWERRLARFNPSSVIIKWSARYPGSEGFVDEFRKLPYKNKVAFVGPSTKTLFAENDCNIIAIPEIEVLDRNGGGDETPYTFRHFNIIDFLNRSK